MAVIRPGLNHRTLIVTSLLMAVVRLEWDHRVSKPKSFLLVTVVHQRTTGNNELACEDVHNVDSDVCPTRHRREECTPISCVSKAESVENIGLPSPARLRRIGQENLFVS